MIGWAMSLALFAIWMMTGFENNLMLIASGLFGIAGAIGFNVWKE